jgi:hypothetical protein
LGAESLAKVLVTQSVPPPALEAQPPGKAGAVTPSKFSADGPPQAGAPQTSLDVQALLSSQGLVLLL